MYLFKIFGTSISLLVFLIMFGIIPAKTTNNHKSHKRTQYDAYHHLDGATHDTYKLPQDLGYPKEFFHPLDSLTPSEIDLVVTIVKAAAMPNEIKFKGIEVDEPNKANLLPSWLSNTSPHIGSIDRRAKTRIVNAVTLAPSWVVVNLKTRKVESWVNARDDQVEPIITHKDKEIALDVALSSPLVHEKLYALGFNSCSAIMDDIGEPGYFANALDLRAAASMRQKLVQVFLYATLGPKDNHYAHPLDFVAWVDIGKQEVVEIQDYPIHKGFDTEDRTGNVVPITRADLEGDFRTDLRPIQISHPEGLSFQVKGRQISWMNFQFRIGQCNREGLVIHHVTYNDTGNIRPLIYRMSVQQANSFKGDPRPPYHRKTSRDAGMFNFAPSAVPLPAHELCRGTAYYLDTVLVNEKGVPTVIPNTTCIVEEDAGHLSADRDQASETVSVRRSQRLVVRQLVNVNNVVYVISYNFYMDGKIELKLKISGVPSTTMMAKGVKAPPYGNLVMPQVYTQSFQYFFGARIDADVDGVYNSVAVEEMVPVGDATENPFGNGIVINDTLLKTAEESGTDRKPHSYWRIFNPNYKQSVNGKPTSLKLIPKGLPNPVLLTNDSPLKNHLLPWDDHDTWVLPFNDTQFFIDGRYMDQTVQDWLQSNSYASIVNTDVVIYHRFGLAHFPDLEDWPIITSIPETGFRLVPSNFFTENPAKAIPLASKTTLYDEAVESSPLSGSKYT